MNSKKYVSSAAIVAMATAFVAVGFALAPAFASAQITSTTPSPAWSGHSSGQGGGQGGYGHGGMAGGKMGMPGVVGTVTAISGNSLTVSGKQGFGSASSTPSTTYTIDATNATVRKNNATSTVASIAVGDMVAVRGTVSGTSVTATSISDGIMSSMNRGNGHFGGMGSSTRPTSMPVSPITGNGQPVIAGSVSAISGNTLTVTNKSNITYTVDISNAKIVQGQATITVSSVVVGDNVIIQGAVSGTSVTASSVIDQKANSTSGAPAGQNSQNGQGQTPASRGGIFSAIGSFFSHIFGF